MIEPKPPAIAILEDFFALFDIDVDDVTKLTLDWHELEIETLDRTVKITDWISAP